MFNLVLLARQAWRVPTEPESLSARILMGIYFPSSGFLEVEVGAAPSRVWRAIMDGKEELEQGII